VVDHLVGLGHRRIAHIHGGDTVAARARRRGYERAMTRAGLAEHVMAVPGAFTDAGGREAMEHVLGLGRRRPTAVFVANDYAALGALGAIADAGLDVPGDISIAGYDNIAVAQTRAVSLTTVEQPSAALGQMAVEMLLERLSDDRTTARHVLLPPKLVVRTSTGPPK
jgi:DNA-binding LacI/PurR family transcriptional regulator